MKIRKSLVTGLVLAAMGLAAPVLAGNILLEDIQVTHGETTEVLLRMNESANGSAVSTFTMTNPDRLVVDVADTEVEPDVASLVQLGGLLTKVETDTFDDGQGISTRVKFYLSEPISHTVQAVGADVVLSISSESAGTDPVVAALGAAEVVVEDSEPEM